MTFKSVHDLLAYYKVRRTMVLNQIKASTDSRTYTHALSMVYAWDEAIKGLNALIAAHEDETVGVVAE